jgi:hypothetical protein
LPHVVFSLRLPEKFEKQQLGRPAFLIIETHRTVTTDVICSDDGTRSSAMHLVNTTVAAQIDFTPGFDHRCALEV